MRAWGETLRAWPWTQRGEKPQGYEDLPAAGRRRPALHVLGAEGNSGCGSCRGRDRSKRLEGMELLEASTNLTRTHSTCILRRELTVS